MLTKMPVTQSDDGSSEQLDDLIQTTQDLLDELNEWMEPVLELESASGTQFGRNMAESMGHLRHAQGLLSLQYHNHPEAVVLSVQRYQELLHTIYQCGSLLKMQKRTQLDALGEEFADLYQHMQSSDQKAALAALSSATDEELRASYRPGQTEQSR